MGSVPDFLTSILPFPLINLFARFIAFLHLSLVIMDLFFTTTFSNNWGVCLKLLNNSLAFFPFLIENKTSKATNKPSPVVANLPKIMWPDCSPPKLNLFFFINSLTCLSPTWDLKNLILFFLKYSSNPKLDIKVPITPPFKIFFFSIF